MLRTMFFFMANDSTRLRTMWQQVCADNNFRPVPQTEPKNPTALSVMKSILLTVPQLIKCD